MLSRRSLEKLADECYRSVEQMDEPFLNDLRSTLTTAIDSTDNPVMKEVRGLGERLAGNIPFSEMKNSIKSHK